jgi:ubiquinone/menaquinone biosynthesis C-methylase UbiE
MTQRFNADTAALEQREALNKAAARFDLEEWIIAHVRPASGQRVLDLGCGRGKQLFALAPLVLPGGSLLGLDVSPDAVSEVRRRAAAEGHGHVEAIECGLDDCLPRLAGRSFERILSTYAIYYARDMVGLIRELRTNLADGGQAFHCGFGRGSNQEIIAIMNRVASTRAGGGAASGGGPSGGVLPIEDFIAPRQIEQLRATYAQVDVARLENHIDFPSTEAVLRWWTNHNSYRPELLEQVRREVAAVVDAQGVFTLTKSVIGVHLHA